MRMSLAGAIATLFVGFISTPLTAQPENSTTNDIADAIAILAKMDWEVDVDRLSKTLKLPDLQKNLKWQGPFARYEAPDFQAVYDPESSVLGIAGLSIHWQIGGIVGDAILNYLVLGLAPGRCPTEQRLTEALGVKPMTHLNPGFDGGPAYRSTTFMVPQHDQALQVSYVGEDTCRITLSHRRSL